MVLKAKTSHVKGALCILGLDQECTLRYEPYEPEHYFTRPTGKRVAIDG